MIAIQRPLCLKCPTPYPYGKEQWQAVETGRTYPVVGIWINENTNQYSYFVINNGELALVPSDRCEVWIDRFAGGRPPVSGNLSDEYVRREEADPNNRHRSSLRDTNRRLSGSSYARRER